MNNPTIYFVCPTNDKPAGGVKQMYRMVDILNRNGYNAFILHKKHHRENWFKNDTLIKVNPFIFKKIKYLFKRKVGFFEKLAIKFYEIISFRIDENAIFVFPEIYGNKFHKIVNNKFVIFNQNCFYSFENYTKNTVEKNIPYLSDKNLGTIVVSENSKEYLNYVFPENIVYRITLGINPEVFSYSNKKLKQIAYMPRKLEGDVNQVIQILKYRNKLSDWDFVAIDGIPENEVAKILKKSALFLSFNHKEGFGLPPAEAMACGCFVVGYTGQGGKEYFNKNFCFPIEEGNIIEFVKKIEEVCQLYNVSPDEILELSKKSSDYILKNYNLLNEEQSIVNIWNQIVRF